MRTYTSKELILTQLKSVSVSEVLEKLIQKTKRGACKFFCCKGKHRTRGHIRWMRGMPQDCAQQNYYRINYLEVPDHNISAILTNCLDKYFCNSDGPLFRFSKPGICIYKFNHSMGFTSVSVASMIAWGLGLLFDPVWDHAAPNI